MANNFNTLDIPGVSSEATAQLSLEHYLTHKGLHYYSTAYESSVSTLILAFKTAVSTQCHILFDWITTGAAHVEIIEGATWTTGTGTQAPVYNSLRSSDNTSPLLEDTGGSFDATMNLVKDPTALAGGTSIYTEYAFGKHDPVRGGFGDEIDLNFNTQYAIKITSDSGAQGLQLTPHWLEPGTI